jgi:hypothetical protein
MTANPGKYLNSAVFREPLPIDVSCEQDTDSLPKICQTFAWSLPAFGIMKLMKGAPVGITFTGRGNLEIGDDNMLGMGLVGTIIVILVVVWFIRRV